MDISILESCGIDYSHGLARFLGDTALYESVLEMFLNDSTMDEARAAMSARDYQALFEAAHQLKGISGNQDMTMLYGCPAVFRICCAKTTSTRPPWPLNLPLWSGTISRLLRG